MEDDVAVRAGRDLTYWFTTMGQMRDGSLVKLFRDYQTALPQRMRRNEAGQVAGLAPCSLRDSMMLFVLGLRLSNTRREHPYLECVREQFAQSAEAFDVFRDAEANEIPGLDDARSAYGDFGMRHRNLMTALIAPDMAA